MWVITNIGFYSIVEKPGDNRDGLLTIRARVKSDLENLRDRYLPALGPITENTGSDYKFRAKVPRLELAGVLSQIVLDIDYDNFKNSVAENQGHERSHLYHELSLGVPIGAELVFTKDGHITCTVLDDSNQVEYEGQPWAISALATHLLNVSKANGFCHFSYEGETLWERRLASHCVAPAAGG